MTKREHEFDYSEYTLFKEEVNSVKEWRDLKTQGECHHKTGGTEPIDLYKSGGILKSFAIGCIIKYAFRNRNRPIVEKDLDKINHYVAMLRVICHEGE